MPTTILYAVFAVLVLWIVVLTVVVLRIRSHYNKLTEGVSKKNLSDILEKILKDLNTSQKDIDSLKNSYDTIQQDGALHLQKFGLLRFNPFKDTGGDQSFILSLLDKNDTGIIISSLYSRSGTRWYAKQVIEGNGVPYELSSEEKKAVKEASAKKIGNEK